MRICVLFIFVLLTGCTMVLWGTQETYKEKINGFYLAGEKDLLLVSGEEYGYVFRINSDFKKLLNDHKDKKLEFSYTNLSVDKKNHISEDIKLFIQPTECSEQEDLYFKSIGLSKWGETYQLETKITGERCKIDGTLPYMKLDDEIVIYIKCPTGPADTVKKIAATPLAITYDATILPIVVASIFIYSVTHPNEGL